MLTDEGSRRRTLCIEKTHSRVDAISSLSPAEQSPKRVSSRGKHLLAAGAQPGGLARISHGLCYVLPRGPSVQATVVASRAR
jgi:hypothetical protein